ncbi:MAG TPA: M23 family metallopeptidase [Pseudacidobacterium sp.]|jgi:murein DD-endopeptidase MepM/ murein hydrolase activator NlpD|nr:M23 family metallopeptidase [Pseudacidobacterium sp.]
MLLQFKRAFLCGILICSTLCGFSEDNSVFKHIFWTPAALASGSPCLFTVAFQSAPSALEGEWFGRKVEFFPSNDKTSWHALAGADVETNPGIYSLTLHAIFSDGTKEDTTRDIRVEPARYKQVELQVPENFVSPDAATLKRIAEEKEIKDKAFAQSASLPLWRGNFEPPLNSPATDSFGTRRIFNGKLASVHRGMDFRAKAGTPVHAVNAGRVILARNLFYEGNCVVIDHGQQFMTIYMHLSKILVKEGEPVQTHQLLGLSGATGRATGPHLHLAVRWQGAYLDPAILFTMKLSGVR